MPPVRSERNLVAAYAQAGLATLLAYLLVADGLIVEGARFQTGVLSGLVAGLLIGPRLEAVVVAAVGTGMGVIVSPPWYLVDTPVDVERVVLSLLVIAVAVAIAAAARLLAERVDPRYLVAAGVVFIVVNLAVSTVSVNRFVFPDVGSQFSILSTEPQEEDLTTDSSYYLKEYYLIERGVPYYEAVREVFKASPLVGDEPPAILSYRLPTVFWLWKAVLPADGAGIAVLFLVFASLGVAGATLLAARFAAPPLALLAAAGVATYFFFAATTRVVTYTEFWGVSLGLPAAACFGAYLSGSRRWLVPGVALAVLAALVREHMVYLLLAAIPAAFVLPPGRRRRDLLMAVGIGLAVVFAGLGLHASRASRHLAEQGGEYSQWLSGGMLHLQRTIEFAQEYVPLKPALPFLLVGAGVAGAAWARPRAASVFLLVATLAPLLGFLILGGGTAGHVQEYWGGYWGAVVVPLAYALVPVALDRVPGLR